MIPPDTRLPAFLGSSPTPLVARGSSVLAAALIALVTGVAWPAWLVLGALAAWIVAGSVAWTRRTGRHQSLAEYLASRAVGVDLVGVLGTALATGGASSNLRWTLLVVPAIFGWAEGRRGLWLIGAVAGAYVLGSVPSLLDGGSADRVAAAGFLVLYAAASAIALVIVASRRREMASELAAARTHSALVDELVRRERRHQADISARLHDGPLQMVIAARQDLDELLEGDEPDLEATRGVLTLAIVGLRDLSRDLFEDVLRDSGLATAVQRVADATRQNGGPLVRVEVGADASGAHDQFVLSIVNELLTNVRKHARATTASVTVGREPSGWLRLTVADDGVGLTPEAARSAGDRGHLGLRSLESRIGAAGGSLGLDDVPRGTVVRIGLPGAPASPDAGLSPDRV